MTSLQDWRSPQFEDELGRLGRGGVSFEFLRRNPHYRRDYSQTLAAIEAGGMTRADALERFSRRWGLAFPGRPRCIGHDRPSHLDRELLPCRDHCHGAAGEPCGFFAS
ncbi:transcriptional regulator domain-containing protein [Xanthobacter sediminis]